MAKTKSGPKPLRPDLKRTELTMTALRPGERQELEQRAEQLGTTTSSFVRDAVLRDLRRLRRQKHDAEVGP